MNCEPDIGTEERWVLKVYDYGCERCGFWFTGPPYIRVVCAKCGHCWNPDIQEESMKSESLGNYSLEGMAVVKQAALARITVRKDDVGKAALQLMIKDIDEKIDSHVDQILSQYIVKAMEDERKAKT